MRMLWQRMAAAANKLAKKENQWPASWRSGWHVASSSVAANLYV